MVAYQDFDFIDEGQTDRDRINWRISNVPDIKKSYADLQLKHVYGHGVWIQCTVISWSNIYCNIVPANHWKISIVHLQTLFTGSKLSRSYQGGESRTDAVVVSNPCISQEFALAIAGRIYVVEKFLSDYKKDVIDVVLPGLDFDDSNNANRAKPDPVSSVQRLTLKINNFTHLSYWHCHVTPLFQKYYEIKDVAFTPTHFAVLKEDSSVYLQSHSIFYQGFAYLTEIPKFRLDAFVKRKWCSKSSYQKVILLFLQCRVDLYGLKPFLILMDNILYYLIFQTSNMLIPGFGRHGVIMFIQIFPTDLNRKKTV